VRRDGGAGFDEVVVVGGIGAVVVGVPLVEDGVLFDRDFEGEEEGVEGWLWFWDAMRRVVGDMEGRPASVRM